MSNQKGSALIITLGVISVVSLAVVLFMLTMRIDRTAAQNARERTQARQGVYTGLAFTMNVLLPLQMLAYTDAEDGDVYRTYLTTPSASEGYEELEFLDFSNNHVFGSFSTNSEERLNLFANDILPLLPPRLTNDIFKADIPVNATWFISVVNSNTNSRTTHEDTEEVRKFQLTGMVNTRIAALVINCSGFLPAALQPWGEDENIEEIRVFNDIPEEYRDTVFHALYDPNPYQFCLNPDFAGHPAATGNVVNAISLNSLTNVHPTEAVSTYKVGLAYAGFSEQGYNDDAMSRLAINFVDFTSTNRAPAGLRLPQDDGRPHSRVDYGYKSLPLIAQVILDEEEGDDGEILYRPSVLIRYPFVPHPSPPEIDLYLNVSTNPAAFTTTDPYSVAPDTEILAIPVLSANTPACLITSDTPLSFPYTDSGETLYRRLGEAGAAIYIWPRLVYSPDNDSGQHVYDEALLRANMDGVYKWEETGSVYYDDPRHNLFAPDEYPPARVPAKYTSPELARFAATEILTNATETADFNKPLGAPWYFPNRPLLHAAELAYAFDDALASTNIILGIDQSHTAALLDCFAALPFDVREDSPPARSNALTRVNPNTPYHDILPPLLEFTSTDPQYFDTLPEPFDNPERLAELWCAANSNTVGRGWNNHAQFLPDLALEIQNDTTSDRRLLNDLLVHIAPQISFRQNAYLVIIQAQRLSPKGRPLATQRAAFTVIRDAFTGQWFIYQTTWLTEK